MSAPDMSAMAGVDVAPSGGSDPSASGEGNPTLADMEAIMRAEEAVDAAATFQVTPREPAAKDPKDARPVDAPGEASAKAEAPKGDEQKEAPKEAAKATEEPKKDDAAPADAPPVLDPPSVEDTKAELRRIRKEQIKLASEREEIVARKREADEALAVARQYENDAKAWRGLSDKIKADPLAFLEAQGIPVDALLDKVIESEKSPIEREVESLKRQMAEREAAEKKAVAERAEAEKQAENDRIIQEWTARNESFAKSDPAKYDLINALDMGHAVHETCAEYYRLHKVILSPEKAADFVEKTLRANLSKSSYAKSINAESKPASAAAPAATKPAAQPSTGNTAPKRSGSPTLTDVASGDSAPNAVSLPQETEDRYRAVLAEMRASGELPS